MVSIKRGTWLDALGEEGVDGKTIMEMGPFQEGEKSPILLETWQKKIFFGNRWFR